MPYDPYDKEHGPYSKTHKANTPKRQRQWEHVFESEKARGKSDGKAIRMASGVVKKQVAHDKAAAEKIALPALGAIGTGLMAAAKSPGVARRAAIGAGVGALGGAATTGKDQSMIGRAIGGATLGAAGGALSSGNFRSGALRAIQGKPAGRVFAAGRLGAPTAGAMKTPAAVARPMAPPPVPAAPRLGLPKTAAFGSLLKTPGLAGRALGGAAIGAGLGYATRPEGSDGGGRALAGGALGALGGAASSSAFRGNVARAMKGRPTHGPLSFDKARRAAPSPASPGFAAGKAVHTVAQVPEQIATHMRHQRADYAAGRAGGTLADAARARQTADVAAKAQGPLASRIKARVRGALTGAPAAPKHIPVIGVDVAARIKQPAGTIRPVGARPGAATPVGASEKLRAAAEGAFAKSEAGRVSRRHGLGG